MFKKIFFLLLLIIPAGLFAFGGGDDDSSSDRCRTNFPIVLAHGMGATDDMLGFIDYWYGIEGALKNNGADVYVTKVNCMDTTENKAIQFRKEFLEVLAISKKLKANIIGHSHGTIYTRYAISNLGLSSKVVSHTSISGPHGGSAVADVIIKVLPDSGKWLVGSIIDIVYSWILGDKNPNTMDNAYDLERNYMQNVFNPNTPNVNGIYYQSWANKIKWLTPELVMQPTWLLLLYYEGPNDGLVSVNSAKWGEFKGVISGSWWCGGVSHYNIIGHILGMTPGFSAPDFFVDIAAGLKEKNF